MDIPYELFDEAQARDECQIFVSRRLGIAVKHYTSELKCTQELGFYHRLQGIAGIPNILAELGLQRGGCHGFVTSYGGESIDEDDIKDRR